MKGLHERHGASRGKEGWKGMVGVQNPVPSLLLRAWKVQGEGRVEEESEEGREGGLGREEDRDRNRRVGRRDER